METREENQIFNSTLDEKPLNLKQETREENYVKTETPGLKTFQPRQGHEEENRGIKGQSLSSEDRLITPYNSRERNPILLAQRVKPYGIVGWKIVVSISETVLFDKLAMQTVENITHRY